jgi:crotonobetainyl-CoA:carnitine CoA-transferase CaiB-like acyl-CoA transferase
MLAGVKVADFGRYVAGPWCAQLLQGLGADVVRIERPGGGEDRSVFPIGSEGVGAYFVHCNRGKRAMTLQPTKPEGRDVVQRLVGWADVVIANLPDETLAAMGLDWPTVHATNPRAVLATVTAFGTSGPYAGRLGFDGVGQVMSGATHLAGPPGTPTKSFVPYVDYGTAGLLAFATVAALFDRERTGLGRRVEGSLLGTALSMSAHALIEQAASKTNRESTGNRHPAAGPSDIVATRDGHLIVQVVGDAMFARWCRLVERADLVDDPRFADDLARGANGEVISGVLAAWCAARTTAEALAALAEAAIPAGPLYTPQQALDDPHIRATVLTSAVAPGFEGPVTALGLPVSAPGSSTELGAVVPSLGEHTDSILGELGYGDEEIEALRDGRVV